MDARVAQGLLRKWQRVHVAVIVLQTVVGFFAVYLAVRAAMASDWPLFGGMLLLAVISEVGTAAALVHVRGKLRNVRRYTAQ